MKEIETCTCSIIHDDIVQKVIPSILNDDKASDLASFFKVFSDPTRIKILSALFISEMCVCDLAASLNMTHSAISHQLRTFKAAKLVKSRKEGKVVYYSLADTHIQQIFHQGYEHICED
ncbi:metalloregulator ArsR/SmtB family transcription factor [Niameybacter massiliensis]|uniref:Metalloregulator ArsR/SmtB family transcription factor n=1 Tax=Holtiella tumoricola TaxID=3018743 RepID=A0AA42DTU8_9FIRM|nr:metalloregulator ArsR/SmtB family transcription factor [Holtiella tumoricola]MDA3733857.1 metalloregulator ArsR/SmtB family transcription factor [Holtiella tumoricola]